jgi:rubrerythrin
MKKIIIAFILLCIPLRVSAENYTLNTYTNLLKAIKIETNASHRYELFAQKASKEGYAQISKLFWAVSVAESLQGNNHKALLLRLGERPYVIEFERVIIGGTKQNLEAAIRTESIESEKIYPQFLKEAESDKLDVTFKYFNYALDASTKQEKLFKNILEDIGKNKEINYQINRITGEIVGGLSDEEYPEDGADKYLRIK